MRLLAWNIQAGGGARLPLILNEIARLHPDIVALSEVTYGNLHELQRQLREFGLEHIVTTCKAGGPNSVLLASRLHFRVSGERVEHDPERWLSVELEELDLKLLCVHVPSVSDNKFGSDGFGLKGARRKELFWGQVISYAQRHKNERVILLGDFNSGLARDAESDSLTSADQIKILSLERYVDTWRHQNRNGREFTYYSKQGKKEQGTSQKLNGFRLDYVFVSNPLRDSIFNAMHVHTVRTSGLSDHSIVLADLSIGPVSDLPVNLAVAPLSADEPIIRDPAEYAEGLGELVRAYRKYLSVSQRCMAERLGMSERSFSDVETGRRLCPPGFLDSIRKLVGAFDSDVAHAVRAARDAAAAQEPPSKAMTIDIGDNLDGGWAHAVLCRAAVTGGLLIPVRNVTHQETRSSRRFT